MWLQNDCDGQGDEERQVVTTVWRVNVAEGCAAEVAVGCH